MGLQVARKPLFPVGTLVKHHSLEGGAAGYGVVVESNSGGHDEGAGYYVACVDASATAAGQPRPAPYILCLPAMSLTRIEGDPRRPIWEREKPSLLEKLRKSRLFWAFALIVKVGITVGLVAALIQRSSCN
jgi:hypothetical protein